jgi:hypothetical protein
MKHVLLITLLAICAHSAGCKEQAKALATDESESVAPAQPGKIDYSTALPEKQDGEFFRSVRQEPNRKVRIDLRSPSDLSGIPEVKWFPMGDNEFCAIQGTTDTTLILPSGKTIEEEFSIVYIDRDSEGIFQVKADSLGWLRLDVAAKRLDREVDLMIAEGADKAKVLTQRQSVLDWLTTFDHNSPMRSAIAHSTDQFRLYFEFVVTMSTDMGISYRYTAEIPRSKERRKREYEKRQNKP